MCNDSTDAAKLIKTMRQEYSNSPDHLVWEEASMLSNSRPPSSLVVFSKDGDVDMTVEMPPIFDGSVVNATPPPLLHLASVQRAFTFGSVHSTCP